jgi:hypothetical protein
MTDQSRKAPRARMFLCPKCQFKSPAEPKRRGDPVAKSACIHCFAVSENDKVDSWLE